MFANTAESALADIKAIDKWCYDNPVARPPASAVAYIGKNRDLLLCLIGLVASMSEAARGALKLKHIEIDESTVSKSFFSIPRIAVETAWTIISGNDLVRLSSDDVHMIRRALQYVKYIPTAQCSEDLVLSPVQLPH